MDRPEIVIRDIHRHGEDLTVPQAIARICGGGPVTVTVTGPAPARRRPARRPAPWLRHHRHPPPSAAPPGRDSRRRSAGTAPAPRPLPVPPCSPRRSPWPASSPPAPGPVSGQSTLSRAATVGSARRQDAARPTLARAMPDDCRDITARPDAGDPVAGHLSGAPALSGALDLARCFGLSLAAGRVLTAVEDTFFAAAEGSFWAEAERIARERAARHPDASPGA